VVSALWAWLPSFLNRAHGIAPAQAAVQAALVVLAGAAGSVVWGAVADRAGVYRPAGMLYVTAAVCIATLLLMTLTFALHWSQDMQYALMVTAGFLMTCSV